MTGASFGTAPGAGNALLADEAFGFYSSEPWLATVQAADGTRAGYLVCGPEAGVGDISTPTTGVAPVSLPDEREPAGNLPHLLFPYRPQRPYVLLGPRRGYRNALAVRNPQAAGRLLSGAAELAAESGRRWVYALHLTDTSADAVSRSGVALPVLSPLLDTWIPLRGDSLEEHFRQLSGHRWRRVRTERRRITELGLHVGRERLGDCVEDVLPLRTSSLARTGATGDTERTRQELQLMAELLAPYEVLITARDRDGALQGYSLSYAWGGVLWERSLGVREEWRGTRTPLLFELEYYRPLEFCLQSGLRALHLGPMGYAAKIARGAVVAPLWQAGLLDGAEVFPPDGVARWTDHVLAAWRAECAVSADEGTWSAVRTRALAYAQTFTAGAVGPGTENRRPTRKEIPTDDHPRP